MIEFVGAEYLIARMLIEKKTEHISTEALNQLGICVRRLSFESNINAVFLTSRDEVYSAIYDYSDFFECVYDADILIGIKIKTGKSGDDLIDKFIRFLPAEVLQLLDDAIEKTKIA